MEVTFAEKQDVWRGRGHPRRSIPRKVREMADATYRTGKVGQVSIGPEDEEDVTELRRLLTSYAKSRGLVMRIQRDDDELRFEMADKRERETANA